MNRRVSRKKNYNLFQASTLETIFENINYRFEMKKTKSIKHKFYENLERLLLTNLAHLSNKKQ